MCAQQIFLCVCQKSYLGTTTGRKYHISELIELLEPFRYAPLLVTSRRWRPKVRPISFTLVVNNCELKYTRGNNFEHLLNALLTKYKVTMDW